VRTIEARLADIARNHRGGKRGHRVPIAAIRVAEIRRVYKDRYGETLPDDDAGREDARILAHHLAQLRDPHRKVTSTLDTLAPWMRPDEVEAVLAKPFRYGADKLAQRLNLTEADRRRLKVKTIGAVDMTREERKAASKRRKRAAEEAEAAQAGREAPCRLPRRINGAGEALGGRGHQPRHVVSPPNRQQCCTNETGLRPAYSLRLCRSQTCLTEAAARGCRQARGRGTGHDRGSVRGERR